MRQPWEDAGRNALENSNSSYNPMLGALGGFGLGGMLGGFFGGGENPQSYLSGFPGTLTHYLSPYANMGQSLIPSVESGYQSMMNPSAFINKMGAGYTESPGYQFNLGQALNASNQAAAAGGMGGSPASQEYSANIAHNMANQDYNQYLNNAEGLYQQGLGGLTGLENQGFGAAGDIASGLQNYMTMQAQLAAAQQAQQEKEAGSLFGSLGSLSSLGSYL